MRGGGDEKTKQRKGESSGEKWSEKKDLYERKLKNRERKKQKRRENKEIW